jgi:hypothetical protein
VKNTKLYFVCFLISCLISFFVGCIKRSVVPCVEDRLAKIPNYNVFKIKKETKFFLDSLKKLFVAPGFSSWRDNQILINVSKDEVNTYLSNHFDTLRLLNRFKLTGDEFLFKTKDGYGIYNDRTQKMYRVESINKNPLSIVDSEYVPIRIDAKKRYIIDQKKIKYIDGDTTKGFLINYGILKKRNVNYLDDNIFLISTSRETVTIGNYPRKYNTKYREVRDAYYSVDENSFIYYTLPYTDSLYKMSIAGTALGSSQIVACRKFDDYLESDKTDLAYKRKYLATGEQNIALEIIDNKYIVVLRRKRRAHMQMVPEYFVAVFDLNLKRLFLDIINDDITPAIFHSDNNVFFLSTNFYQIHEYKIK